MADTINFRRPANDADFSQTKAEKDMMVFKVITGYSNSFVYELFNREYSNGRGGLNSTGKTACRQFFTHPKNIAFMSAYEQTLIDATKGAKPRRDSDGDIGETRKDKALKSLLDRAMSLVESGEELDPDSLKTITEIFRKTNLLKDEVEQTIKPLRFLPERCGSCRARIFVESAVADGSVLDMCSFCKCRKFAEECGYKFDEKNLLDIPKEVMEHIESKNKVSVADILSGKVDN